jgi:hypothetical protein
MLNGVMRREDDIGRYKDKYEESMNPFEAFKGRVSSVFSCIEPKLIYIGSTTRYSSAQPPRSGGLCVDERDHREQACEKSVYPLCGNITSLDPICLVQHNVSERFIRQGHTYTTHIG